MPIVHANGLDIGYEVHGAGPPLIMLHGATSAGREDFAAQVPLFSKAFLVFLPDARGHATTRWDPADGLVVYHRSSTTWPPSPTRSGWRRSTSRLLDGRDDRAPLRDPLAGAAPDADRGRDHHPARAAGERRPPAHGPRLDRPQRARPGRRILPRRHDPVQGGDTWRRLLPAIAPDVADAAPPRAARAAPDRAAGDGRRRRPRPVRPGRPRLGPDAPAARRPAVRGPGVRARGHGPAARPVQRGLRRVLPLDRDDRPRPERGGSWHATDHPVEIEGGSM